MNKHRVKKLKIKDRIEIKKLADSGVISYEKIGKIFNVSKGRVSQIVNDNYNESRFVGEKNAET